MLLLTYDGYRCARGRPVKEEPDGTRAGTSAAIGNDRRDGFLPLLELMSIGLFDRRLRRPRSRPQEQGEREDKREAEAGHEGAGQKVVRRGVGSMPS